MSDTALRGRESECTLLHRVIDDVRASQSRVLVLRGEAGIGKTALVDYLEEQTSGCRVARATGVESEMEFPFAGLHQLCAPMLDHLDHLPAPQRDALATTFGVTAGLPPDQFLVGLGVLSLLTEIAEAAPVVCLVDDAQWLDPSTATTLAFVARRLHAEPVALVFAVREPAALPTLAGLPELHLGGLGDDDAGALLDSVATGVLDERVRDRIIAETHGNPLALLELPRGLSAAELELGFGAPDSTAMASRIEQGFLRQIQQLPTDTRRLLLAAAADPLGDVTVLWRAADHLGIDLAAAVPAEEAELITFGGRVTFRHPLVRSALYRTAGVSELRAVHAALADATDPELDPDRRAWHRAFAAAGPDEGIAAELEGAAYHAIGRGALVTGAAFLTRSAELTSNAVQRGSRALTAAMMKIFAGQFESASESLAAAELCPLDTSQRALLLRLQASVLTAYKRESATSMFLEAAQLFHPLDASTARDAYLNALGAQVMVARLDDEHRLHEVAKAARSAPPSIEPPRPIDLVLDALAVRFTDGHEPAVAPARRALAACTQQQEHNQQFYQWLWFAPHLAPEIWDDELWHDVTEHIVHLNREAGAFSTLPIALEYRAEFEFSAGAFAEASALLDEARTIVQLTRSTVLTHTSLEFAAWQGDEARARNVIDTAVAVIPGDSGRMIGLGEHARAVLYNGLGRYDNALSAARRACQFEDLGLFGRCLVERIEAGARSGARDDAAEALQVLEPRTRAAGGDWAIGMLARSRALLTDDRDAEALYREAIERLGRTRMAAHLARAHLVYGEWLRREQRRIDAREQLRRAYEMLAGMGAGAFAERARGELLATGETVRKRSVEASDELTPQEAQIARLAAEGATNPEIGSRLFISPRTVEYHMSKIFVKLGIKSRRELRGALR